MKGISAKMTGHRSVALLLAMLISSWPKASLGATGNGSIINASNNNSSSGIGSGNNYAFTSEHSEYSEHSDHNANDSMEYDAESVALERIVSTIVPVFFGIIGFAGLLGNGLVILVVVANQQMRSTTNLLIINLAVSDILFVIFCVPFTATDYVLPEWPFGNVWCKFVQYMIVVTCHCSVYTLVLMSFDRFLAVVHPVTSMSLRTERNATLAIMCAWITIVTTAIPVALSHSVRIYQYHGNAGTACVFSTEEEVWSLVGFQVSFFLSSYVAPLTLICFLYMGMLARLWKSAPGCKPSAESRKGKRRVTRMVVVVVLAFAICWLPIHVILVLKALNLYGGSHLSVIIQIISHVVAYTNSCINPILYAFLSDNFRKAFRKVVWCGSPPPLMTNQQVTKTTRTATGNGTSNIEML
ncbi:allatostatin-A receptor [Drosophila takahashii]|uniref:allatostatin-A receptor n=1 Tax=Drosophila takahashii TaxID=29030 RepID=UPI001CF8CC46|nr:allatostatin-A receptor [Drosophila takahashii]